MRRSSFLIRPFDYLGLLFGIAAILAVLYYWDPTRVMIKRLAPGAETRFEQMPKGATDLALADLLTLNEAAAVDMRRRTLINKVFGVSGLPLDLMPQRIIRDVEKTPGAVKKCLSPTGPSLVHLWSRMDTIIMRGIGCEARFYRDWRNLAGIDELTGHMQNRWRNYAIAYFRPVQANGRLILYQQGLAATYHDQHRLIEAWVAEGYTVAAMNMPGYGDNTCYDLERYCADPPMGGIYDKELVQNFAPPVIALNHAMAQTSFERIAMVGVSSGAWVTLVAAALDPRIDLSVPVAGVLPLSLLQGKEESARGIVVGLTDIASVLDLAVMGADRPGRRQIQIFNRFDRCCFYGPRPESYAGDLQRSAAVLGGRLDLLFDESHARHKISDWALRRIMAAIDGGAGRAE
ncbi:MAG: hypothetical protein CMM61_10980 [Rhodospirillaceae bacterium]|nr:hypothetical protein [Rhodospirillaceae bacterium]